MIVNITIHVPDVAPDTVGAVRYVESIENSIAMALRGLDWWIDVKDGETRYKPENVSELS